MYGLIVVDGDTVFDLVVSAVLLSLADDGAISWDDVGVGSDAVDAGFNAVDETVSVVESSVAIMDVSSSLSVSLK